MRPVGYRREWVEIARTAGIVGASMGIIAVLAADTRHVTGAGAVGHGEPDRGAALRAAHRRA
jgi:hypothetical protein